MGEMVGSFPFLTCPTRKTICSWLRWKKAVDKMPKKAFLKKKFIYFIYLFLAALGLHCCARAFSSCGEQGLLFIAVRRLLVAVASLVAEHRL